jgi:hypothetical protein
MPVDHCEPEMVFHSLPSHNFVRVVPAESEGILGFRPLILNFWDIRKGGHVFCTPHSVNKKEYCIRVRKRSSP